MNLLNQVCFTLCLVSIALATLIAFALIWGSGDKDFLWRSELSMGVLFFASAATLSVSKTLGDRISNRAKPRQEDGES